MSFPDLVSIFGQKNVGKGVLADRISLRYGHGVLAFAGPVKKTVSDVFGVSLEFIEEWKNRPEPPPGWLKTMRECLIFVGDGLRQFDPDVYARLALSCQLPSVITDGRYFNEAAFARSRGGVCILLARPGFENDMPSDSERLYTPLRLRLLSLGIEGAIDDPYITHFFVNDGTPDDLFRKVRASLGG